MQVWDQEDRRGRKKAIDVEEKPQQDSAYQAKQH